MKKIFLPLIASLAVLSEFQALAEVVIYHGTAKVNYKGEDRTWSVDFKVFLIVDQDTADIRQINYANFHGQKYYFPSHFTNLHFVTVNAPKSKSVTVISRPPSDCDRSEGAKYDSLYMSGPNATITISTNTTLSFPRMLSAPIIGIHQSASETVLLNGSMASNFDKQNTLASNAAGENLEAAYFRLRTFVQGLGYSLAPGETDDNAVSAVEAFRPKTNPAFDEVR